MVYFFAMLGMGDLRIAQHKNPNAAIAVDSLHAATTFEPKKKSNENGLEYIN